MAAISSQGSKLQVSISSTFTDVTKIDSIMMPSVNADYDDVTTLAATAYKEYLPVLKDVSQLQVSGIWEGADTAQVYLRAANLSQALESFKVIMSDSGSYTVAFSAYVQTFEVTAATNKAQRFTMTLRVSGAITDTP